MLFRSASRALQEKSKVKTRCFRIGSYRLYAPMVPLAPHPCVRWWNTEEITLKLTRLDLHSLKGGSPTGCYRPLRRCGYQRTGNGIPPTQRQWRKRDHGSFKRRPPKTEGHPKVFYPRNNPTKSALYPVVPHLAKISTGLPFLFRSPEPLFLLHAKEKVVLAPAGQAENNPPPGRQKKKCFPPQDARPTHKEAQPGNIRPPLPKTTHPGGVDTSEQVTVFHPLNGSGARGTTGRSNAGRRKQKDSPKDFTRGIPKQGWGFVRLYRSP